MTWTAYHRRGDVLRTVIDTADARRDGQLPLDVEGVHETFRDELDLLAALLLRWHTRLSGRIERRLTSQPLDLEGAVVAAWHDCADALPGIRAIVDTLSEAPLDEEMASALRKSAAKEHVLLAVMAGQGGPGDPGTAGVGAALEAKARATHRPRPRTERPASTSPSLVERLKAVLVA